MSSFQTIVVYIAYGIMRPKFKINIQNYKTSKQFISQGLIIGTILSAIWSGRAVPLLSEKKKQW